MDSLLGKRIEESFFFFVFFPSGCLSLWCKRQVKTVCNNWFHALSDPCRGRAIREKRGGGRARARAPAYSVVFHFDPFGLFFVVGVLLESIGCCFFFVLLWYIPKLVVCRSPGPSQRHHVFLRDGGTRGGRPSRQWVLMCSPPGNVWRTALDITYDGWWPFAEGVMRWFFFAPRALSQGNEEE